MNTIQIFNNSEFGNIRTVHINGTPYFVGNDVARALEYKNPRKAILDHIDNEDKGVTKCDTLGGGQNLTIINESGLYSLILLSKLPKAKEFKRWVTAEVLPTIRKTGSYGNIDLQKVITETIRATTTEVVKQLMPMIKEKQSTACFDEGDIIEEVVVKKRTRRKPAGIIEKLDPDMRKIVDNMICSPQYTYKDIMEMLCEEGIPITQASISRYAKRYY